MTINSVSLIAGALSFSAALAWNKAVSETLNNITKTNSPILQAIVITLIIMFVVFCINYGLHHYTQLTKIELKDSVIKSGGNIDSKVKLFHT